MMRSGRRVTRRVGIALLTAIAGVSMLGAASPSERDTPGPKDVEMNGMTALHQAVDRNDVSAVERLLNEGADVHARTRFDATPLWIAASNGNGVIVERLLRAGADAKTMKAANGETVLMMAARSGSVEAVEALLSRGADVNAAERLRNQTALMWAAAQKHPAVVELLLRHHAAVKVKSKTGLTPLMFAIRAGDIASTRLLLDAGADLAETYSDGTTPLVLAIVNARYEVAALLLDRGANPNAPDSNGSALAVLTWMRRAEGAPAYGSTARSPSDNLDEFALAKKLLEHGADINARLEWKDSPRPAILGTDNAGSGITFPKYVPTSRFNFVSFVGATPFCLAAFNMDAPFMRFLAEHGADATIPTRQNVTPLLAAAGVGYRSAFLNDDVEVMEAVQVAYDLGNDVHAIVDFSPHDFGDWRWNGANALHGAAARGNLPLIKWLADKGVSFEQTTEGGWLPLDAAEGIWYTGFAQHKFAAAKLIRELMVERGMTPPRPRTDEEVASDGRDRQIPKIRHR
jgi:ankyrin repeat protein